MEACAIIEAARDRDAIQKFFTSPQEETMTFVVSTISRDMFMGVYILIKIIIQCVPPTALV